METTVKLDTTKTESYDMLGVSRERSLEMAQAVISLITEELAVYKIIKKVFAIPINIQELIMISAIYVNTIEKLKDPVTVLTTLIMKESLGKNKDSIEKGSIFVLEASEEELTKKCFLEMMGFPEGTKEKDDLYNKLGKIFSTYTESHGETILEFFKQAKDLREFAALLQNYNQYALFAMGLTKIGIPQEERESYFYKWATLRGEEAEAFIKELREKENAVKAKKQSDK